MLEEVLRVDLLKKYAETIGYIAEIATIFKQTLEVGSREAKRLDRLVYGVLEDFSAITLECCSDELDIGEYSDDSFDGEPMLGEDGTSLAIPDLETLDKDFQDDLQAFQQDGVDADELLDAEGD